MPGIIRLSFPESDVNAPRSVIDDRDGDDLRQAVEIGITLVAQRPGIAAQKPGGFQGRDPWVERGNVVDEAVGLVDQTGNLVIRGRPQRVDLRSEIGDGLGELLALLHGQLAAGGELRLVEQVVERVRQAAELRRQVGAAERLQRRFELLIERIGGAGPRGVAVGEVNPRCRNWSICCLTPVAVTPLPRISPFCSTGKEGSSSSLSRT